MTVCRYFIKGCCRFGDRCRFEHPEQKSDQNYHSYRGSQQDSYRYQNQQYSNQDNYNRTYEYPYSSRRYASERYSENPNPSYESQDMYSEYQRYESPDRYTVNQRHSSPDRYNANQRYSSPDRYSGNQRYSSTDGYSENYNYGSRGGYSSSNYYNQQHTYKFNQEQQSTNKYSYAQTPHKSSYNERYSSNNRYSENIYGQNRYQWLSEDYSQQRQQQTHSNAFSSVHQTSTPKNKGSISFKVPDSELKEPSAEDQTIAKLVQEDATAWELGEQWPFTCYFPYPDKPAFPGFSDVSPEELRYEAYKAKENNAYESYVETVNNALLDIKEKRSQLKIPSLELMNIIGEIRKGVPYSPTSVPSPFLQFGQSTPESMNAAFSVKSPVENGAFQSTSVSTFSFKLPGSEFKSSGFGLPSSQEKSSDVYTLLEELTEDEKEQFSASTFTLGKIPTQPPPHVLCF